MRVCASISSAPELDECDTRMVEIRLDLLGGVPESKGRDLLVTYRGPIDLGILPEGFSGMIDIGEEPRPETGLTVVASYHDYDSTPNAERISSILGSMDADIAKGAFSVSSFRDLMSIHDAAVQMRRRHVILGMGGLGTVTRIRASMLGNEFSFGYVGEPTAPGQLSAARMEELGDDCMILGILGNPLSKSKSPAMQNAALESKGINGIYLPFEAPDLEQVEDVIRAYDIKGINVTIPYKQEIMDHLDLIDADASEIGAVNTVVNKNGTLTGYNTDTVGIMRALGNAGFDPQDRRVLILGSGGAARACAHILKKNDADVTITGRNKDTGSALATDTDSKFKDPNSVSVKMYDLVVNCTPVGMYSDGPYPINIMSISRHQTVFDMVYGKDTPLTRHARDIGCRIASGEDMLAGQGEEAFRLWTGETDVFKVMRDSI